MNPLTDSYADVVHYAVIFYWRYQNVRWVKNNPASSEWCQGGEKDVFKALAFARMKLLMSCAIYKVKRTDILLGG